MVRLKKSIKKKASLKSNGTREVTIKGLDGILKFNLERYIGGGDYFSETHQFVDCKESSLLRELIFTGVQENSYASVSNHLVLIMGKKILSSNEISEQVKEHAHKYTQELIASYVGTQIVIPFARALSEGIYDKNVKEIGYFDDGIVVKKQKEKRNENYITDLPHPIFKNEYYR